VPLMEVLGWSLLHSIWQGALVAAALWGLLRVVRPTAPHLRYILSLLAMVVLLALPVVNYWQAVRVWEGHRVWLVHTATTVLRDRLAVDGFTTADEVTSEVRRRHDREWLPSSGLTARVAEAGRGPVRGLAWLWIGATLLGVLRLRRELARAERLSTGGAPEERWRDACRRITERMSLDRRIRVRVSDRMDVPALVGWRWPVILVPRSALELPTSEMEAVLAHELSHVCRQDYLANVLQTAAEALLALSPPAWWVSARIREERECSCDRSAIRLVEGGAPQYLRTLLSLESRRPSVTGALALTGGPLLRRIRRIHAGAADGRRIEWRSAAAMALVVLATAATAPDHGPPLAPRVSVAGLMLQDLDGMRLVVQRAAGPDDGIEASDCPDATTTPTVERVAATDPDTRTLSLTSSGPDASPEV
jgi:Zn-dependent protease with chaperone function